MPEYLSPGVYVEEVPSMIKPIAGVSTSTAAFVGIVPDSVQIPEDNPAYDPTLPVTPDNSPFRFWTFPFPEDQYKSAKEKFEAATAKDDNTGHFVKPARPANKKDKDGNPIKDKDGKPVPPSADDFRNFRALQEAYALASARRAATPTG